MDIRFNEPAVTGCEKEYIAQAIASGRLAGDNQFTRRCESLLEAFQHASRVLLTPSCTHALELAALLLDIGPGDEVIVPSYTFVTTANSFALRGARIVFVDVEPTTMNICPKAIEAAVTEKTKVIVPVHYAGVICDMTRIMDIANRHGIYVVEDSAQALSSEQNGQMAGSFGQLATFSFHETKNYTAGGEGGALVINDPALVERAEIIREKGTDRSRFFRGEVDKYSWIDIGSSYLPSELQAAYLFAQLENIESIRSDRLVTWNSYASRVAPEIENTRGVECMSVAASTGHNAHMYFLKCENLAARQQCLETLSQHGVHAVFHYVPLHSSNYGMQVGEFRGDDVATTSESERLIRLPLWYGMPEQAVNHVIDSTVKAIKAAHQSPQIANPL